MNVIESFLTNNPCYTAGRKITPIGLMLHSVGCPQPSAMVFVNSWNNTSFSSACVHAFIDANNGNVYQTLPWNHRGWHGGGSSNNTHIGVEMCEPECIKYISGSSFTCSNREKAVAMVTRTYESAVNLFAMLCEEYNLDPMKDGVIISHKEGHDRGIATDHGDPEHLWGGLGLSYTMDGFRKDVKSKIDHKEANKEKLTKIEGESVATIHQMRAYIKKVNPNVPKSVLTMIPIYITEGRHEGIRGDIAFAQSCLETGNFTFEGSAVTLDQNNFCGMGVVAKGIKGNSFLKPKHGIRAQIQHLKAYASKGNLNRKRIDPRFEYVTRNSAPYVEWLGAKENPTGNGWANGADYGYKILDILNRIIKS